jgi:salicylate hydroxylase
MYEKICVGNKRSDAQNVFFEGMLLEKGLGKVDCMIHVHRAAAVLTSILIGEGQPWFGNSSWGHPDFDRKSVRLPASVHYPCVWSLLIDKVRHIEETYSKS